MLTYLKYFIRRFTSSAMAKSKYEYVKQMEMEQRILPRTYIVVRIDGKGFHRFAECHNFVKPNDERALNLMTRAAQHVFNEFNDIVLAYGQSDEYSFVFRKESDIYQRRHSKILSTLVSTFTSSYVFNWSSFFTDKTMQYPPVFDGRISLLTTPDVVKDYLMWRQTDCHINNLHNTCFWKLVQEGGLSPNDSQRKLQTMLAGDKNEMLFSEFQTNYNNLPALFRKGTIIVKEPVEESSQSSETAEEDLDISKNSTENVTLNGKTHRVSAKKKRMKPVVMHVDIYGEEFWKQRPHLL